MKFTEDSDEILKNEALLKIEEKLGLALQRLVFSQISIPKISLKSHQLHSVSSSIKFQVGPIV